MSSCNPLFATLPNNVLAVVCALLLAPDVNAQVCNEPVHAAMMTSGIWAEEVTWEVTNMVGDVVAGPFGPYEDNTTVNHELCLTQGCYRMHMMDSFGDGWQGAALTLFNPEGVAIDVFSMEQATDEAWQSFSIAGECGCTDPLAVGYNPQVSWDDGSCWVCPPEEVATQWTLSTGLWAEELQVQVFDGNGALWFDGASLWGDTPWDDNTTYTWTGCLAPVCAFADLIDTYGDGWQGGVLTVQRWDNGAWQPVAEGSVPANGSAATLQIPLTSGCPVYGCTQEEAFNFNPLATEDDGTCTRQSDNVLLYAAWSDVTLPTNGLGGSYSDVEGLEVLGREYAVVGSTLGTHVVDVTEPGNAFEVHFLPGADGGSFVTHRDYHVHGSLLYAVCDQGASSLQIWDLSTLPDPPVILYDDDEFVERAHNVFVDDATLTLYLASAKRVGLNTPLLALDVTNPSQPTQLVDLAPWIGGCHDLFAWNDTVWINGGGVVRVVDMNPTPHLLGSLDDYPFQGGNHSGWWVPEDDIYVFADETHGSPLKVVDVADITDMQVVSLLSSETAPDAIPHNLMIRDQFVFVSYYHDGLQVFDISNPDQPVKVAWFDTFAPNHHNGFAGAWGVHSALPSGRVLISDVQRGLFVLALNPDIGSLCPGEEFMWQGQTLTTPGTTILTVPDNVWGADIAWLELVESEDCPPCFGDFDGDGIRGVSDLQILLSQVGCIMNCNVDLSGDGSVSVNDMLMWLGVFGWPCPQF